MANLTVNVTARDSGGLVGIGSAVITTTTGDPWAALDGRLNAPAGVPPIRPTLLNPYQASRRPPWQVAGVHYGVGVPANIALKAATSALPSGASRSGNVITVTGNNVTLDGYDFSSHQISVRAANTRIVNCWFAMLSSNLCPVITTTAASNTYIGYCFIDGMGRDPSPNGGLITWFSPGITIEYCYLGNSAGDILQAQGGPGGNIVLRYNFMEQAGTGAGAHGDLLQCFNATKNPTAVINFNGVRQDGGFTQGFIVEQTSAGEIGNNTFSGGGDLGQAMGLERASVTGLFRTHDNYFADLKYGFSHGWAGGSQPGDNNPNTVFTNNVNMVTGAVVQD